MEVLLQYLDELDDAWFFVFFLLTRPHSRLLGMLVAGLVLAACGSSVN